MLELYVDSSLTEACLVSHGQEELRLFAPYNRIVTNNMGEYFAVVRAISFLGYRNLREGVIKTDSEFVVNQVRGIDAKGQVWKHCQEKFKPYRDTIRRFLADNPKVSLVWVPREENLAGKELERRKKVKSGGLE